MASTPPYDPRAAWRVQRDQQRAALRAQREALKTQRAYWKARRQPSLVGPLVLIAIGIVALLLATGKIAASEFWPWYAKWWPMLLVVIGFAMLIEWFIDRNNPYPVRRTGGVIFLILLAAGMGWAASSWHSWGPSFRDQFGDEDNDFGFFHFMGEEHDKDEQNTVSIPAGAHIQIQSPRGDVTVAAVDATGTMQVRTHEAAFASSDDEAQRIFSVLSPHVTVSGTSVLIRVDSNNNGKADLSIEIPKDASVDVSNSHGDVTVAGCRGAVNVNSNHGDVKFDDLGTTAHARMTKGDFSAHAIQGDLSLDGRMEDVTISEIRGKVLLQGDFFGDLHVEHVAAPLHFHSSRTDIQLSRIDGDLTMDSGDLHMSSIAGPTQITTRSKDIDVSQVYGDLKVENSNGSVQVAAAAPLGQIQIENRNGQVKVMVPPSAGFSLEAHATHGNIQTDFNLPGTEENNKSSVVGSVGKGGPRISLNTSNNDIQISKGETFPPLPPTPPAVSATPPVPPAPPKGAKHLAVPKGTTPPTPVVQ